MNTRQQYGLVACAMFALVGCGSVHSNEPDGAAVIDPGAIDASAVDADDTSPDAATDTSPDAATDMLIDASVMGAPDAASPDAALPIDYDAAGPPDAGPIDAMPCAPGTVCAPTNIAFVTSSTHTPTSLGTTAADAICNQRATAAGLAGTYVAWLSSDTSSARSRLGNASGWVRTDGRPFAATATALYGGRIAHPLEYDENGNRLNPTTITVATGTAPNGNSSSANCANWTGGVQATGGVFTSGSREWTNGFLPNCTALTRLYCLGRDVTTGHTVTPVAGRLAFVSSATVAPDAGLAAADAVCNSDASAAGLPGTYRALMTTATATAISRFDTTGAPWVRIDGVPLADTAAGLASSDMLNTPVLQNANGNRLSGGIVWVGGSSVSVVATDNCSDWSDSTSGVRGHFGRVDRAGENWFGESTVPCNFSALSVYCLQQ